MKPRILAISLLPIIAFGCGESPRRVHQDGLVAEVVFIHGDPFLKVTSDLPRDERIAFPTSDCAFVERDGERWSLDGKKTTVTEAKGIFENVSGLQSGSSLVFPIEPSLQGVLVIEVRDLYAAEWKRLDRTHLWTGRLRVGDVWP